MRKFTKHLKFLFTSWKFGFTMVKYSPIQIMVIVAGILIIVNLLAAWPYYISDTENFKVQLIAESHGMVLDILVLGVLLLWVNSANERKRNIDNAFQEIADLGRCLRITEDEGLSELYRHSTAAENLLDVYNAPAQKDSYACLRIIRNIRTLNRYRITQMQLDFIDLPKAALNNSNLSKSSMIGFRSISGDFSQSSLTNCILNSGNFTYSNFSNTDLRGSHIQNTVFNEAIMVDANLQNCSCSTSSFQHARLNRADFSGSDLMGCDFTGAYLMHTSFLNCKNLRASQIIKAKYLKGCLFDEELEKEIDELKRRLAHGGRQVKINIAEEPGTNVPPSKQTAVQKIAG